MTQSSPRPTARAGGKTHACEAGLAPGTTVLTLDGEIPVEFLNPGDRIITRRGVRKLKAVMRHNLPEGTPRVVISADALGGKPATDVTLMPGQRILVRDWRAQALWGKDVAAPQVQRLVDGKFIRSETKGRQIMLSLYFGAPEVLYADGLELASADKPRVVAKAK
ncbi:Hint domain-containing protein [Hasllibacter sp. MH4015]|uniref:Hint domain-containing protein n=1 Tax=Hasllibacter sp. MH4015 TaxID=2854029 RepID=UPI001CD491B5|nr:Hint domain-containing protein [Hasllibacter sp. MH4015]